LELSMTRAGDPGPGPRSRIAQLLRVVAGALGVSVAVALALLLTGALSGGSNPQSRHLARAIRHCQAGTRPADGPTGGGDGDHPAAATRACVLLGQPESFSDMARSASQLAARDTAPFASTAPGAYEHAFAQRAAVPGAGSVPGSGFGWTPAGSPPECAAPSSSGSACPAASAENGNYSYMGQLGFRTLSGRISAFAYDPSTQNRYFAAPVVGGVWETLDGGTSWRSIGDGLPTQTVGAIAYDAPLHRIIIGTGDNSFGQDGIAGLGIYYSDDDGATWTHASGVPDLALSFKLVVSPADASGQTVYAATSRGLFRSTDGGPSFVNEDLPTSPAGYSPNCAGDTTSRLCFFANIVTDVVVKPTMTANGPAGAVLAVVGWRAGQKLDTDASNNPLMACSQGASATACKQSPQNGLYTSSTGAPGSFAFQSGSSDGFAPDNVVGRTALAVAHGSGQNSDAVYALVEDAQKFNHCPDLLDTVNAAPTCNATLNGEAIATVLDGMYASYDFGKTWTKIMDWTQLKQPGTNSALTAEAGYSPGVQAWYNLWVEPDPTLKDSSGNPTRLLFGLEEVWENNRNLPSGGAPPSVLATPYQAYPGGTAANDPWLVIARYWNACGGVNSPVGPCNPSFTTSNPTATTTVHPDQHAYAMIPDGKGGVTLLIGSDGGAFSQHVDAGQDFNNDNWGDGLNASLATVQPYDAEMAKDGTIVSGLQDNGEMKTAPNGHESEIYGGDAFFNTIDPDHSQNIIEEYTYASQVNLTTDGGTTWFGIAPSQCGSSTNALFSTPMEQDPTQPGHILLGCTQLQEVTGGYNASCADPSCSLVNVPTFNTVYDLSTLPSPNGAPNIPSALAVHGANEYVGYCGYCDPATQAVPFGNGIATNVGGSQPPQIGTSNGWHQAAANCAACGTANGKLPNRYISSIQEDPNDPNTVYVTLGGYNRHWIPPGSYGEDISNVGSGHVFVSHDHGESFTDISGNLPDIPANWTTLHNGQLIVATDLGVFVQLPGTAGAPSYGVLGTGLPTAPVMTVRVSPANPDVLLVSTYGRSNWEYNFATNSSNGGGGSTAGSSPTTTATPGASTTTTPPKKTAPACSAGTRLTYRIRRVPHGRVVRVVVYVNGHRALVRKGRSIARVTIRRPAGNTLVVRIVSTNNKGGQVTTIRRYVGCKLKSSVTGKTKRHRARRRRRR
jgi:hypothetical protein